jgi:coenzyme F420-reducing hydrogenase beta subunit
VVTLYIDEKDCCGCAACKNICSRQAITMEFNKDGFLYPSIKKDLCIECGRCKKVCAFQNVPIGSCEPLDTYVAINKDQYTLSSSASGGIFGALATFVLKKNGIVFGCAFDTYMNPIHISIDNPADIKKLQGSKYVQSNIGNSYIEAERYLKQGKYVLFTGTPCQIAGLKSYLGKAYHNLITADIICHGVPSVVFFKEYIKYLEDNLKGKVIDFRFRDKSKGNNHMGKVIYKKNGIIYEKYLLPLISYYYYYFLKGHICRQSCYSCKYAGGTRQGDYTMGDYWGIKKIHPEIETKNGVSILLINSEKGLALIDELSEYLTLTKSNFEQGRVYNAQLNHPVTKSEKREDIFKLWRNHGYQAVAEKYYKMNRKRIVNYRIKALVPQSIKNAINKVLLYDK